MNRHISVPTPAASTVVSPVDRAGAILRAAECLLPVLAAGRRVGAGDLKRVMTDAFAGDDVDGAWVWKDAYEACEAAQILFLRRYGAAMRRSSDAAGLVAMMQRVGDLLPTQTRRSDESEAFQQFSTPLALGHVIAHAAGVTTGDLVLEPSAGTGLLAIHAESAGATLALNELAPTRAELLELLFPSAAVFRHDAAAIDDRLDEAIRPTLALMNPPFSVAAHVEGRVGDAAMRHIRSALARLADGGRLVAITGAALRPDSPHCRHEFVRLQEKARVVFTAAIDGRIFSPQGTQVETRLTIIDKAPADHCERFPASLGMAPHCLTLLRWVDAHAPPRLEASAPAARSPAPLPLLSSTRAARRRPVRALHVSPASIAPVGEPLAYELVDRVESDGATPAAGLYEPYALQTIRLPGAQPHPTRLVQSAAMASVAPPRPTYRPLLPPRVLSDGLLSDAQLESVVYAGEAHEGHLAGAWSVDATHDVISAAPEGAEGAVRFRRGWFLGDGTGCGKGRQVAGILLDHWLRGRRRALWVSKSDKLLEDAQRDWSALGMERLLVTPLSRFRQGTPIRLVEAVLFTTYATIRSAEREGRASRVEQIVEWLGRDFDGIIVFDEAHAMANAAGAKTERGDGAPSQQGRAGLRLQHALPDARVVYVSATGATGVENLAYAQRLGLWGGADFPFANRSEFVTAIEEGGVAAMEVLARDLKSLGLYAARALSYEGVEYEPLEHCLTPGQVAIYDAYAGAFQIIHANLRAALEATNIRSGSGTLNGPALSSALSAFEASKQRFFAHLIVAMKTPTLIAAIERDLAEGRAAVVQIVSTGEALMERRLADIPTSEWSDIQVDVTPREYVLDYLKHSFPTQLFEPYTDSEGNLASRPVFVDGQPVQCRDAVARRDRLIEQLASLDPVQAALDQIVQRFGTEAVAEVTGRSRRIVRRAGRDAIDRLAVETRPAAANIAEAQAFMDDDNRILVFSDAGGTGRSYHADLGARNQRLRVHYLLEAGWRADTAIQGLGRTNRTNQAQPPLFRPVATDVRAEKRFLSTIARRLDALGAITRGQRQTGGQGLFRAGDNLESPYARAALRTFYARMHRGEIEGCSLGAFQEMTGLSLTDPGGGLKDDLPPITTFLNRLLALTIAMQNRLFAAFEEILAARIEGAIAGGHYDVGVETLNADSLVVKERRTIHTHAGSGAQTQVLTVLRRDRLQPLALKDALRRAAEPGARLLLNPRSGRAAVQVQAASIMLDDGAVERRVRLLRPAETQGMGLEALKQTLWQPTDPKTFAQAWTAEIAGLPEFSTNTLHIVAGLLLPLWKRIPEESCRVYRLQTDDGERIIGRVVSPAALSVLLKAVGLDGTPKLDAADAWEALRAGRSILHLADGLQMRRSLVMHDHRIELCGFSAGMKDRLVAIGLFSEIITWKLRLFVPSGERGPAILAALLELHPLTAIVDRDVA